MRYIWEGTLTDNLGEPAQLRVSLKETEEDVLVEELVEGEWIECEDLDLSVNAMVKSVFALHRRNAG